MRDNESLRFTNVATSKCIYKRSEELIANHSKAVSEDAEREILTVRETQPLCGTVGSDEELPVWRCWQITLIHTV